MNLIALKAQPPPYTATIHEFQDSLPKTLSLKRGTVLNSMVSF